MSNITADFDNILNWVDKGNRPPRDNSILDQSYTPTADNIYTVHTYHSKMVNKFKQTTMNRTYQIHLRVKKQCEAGQSIVILGGIPELGSWNKEKPGYRMRWSKDDYWITEEPITTSKYYFQYKYVIWDDKANKMVSWERGIDRLIDCEVLDDYSNTPHLGFMFNKSTNAHCVILDEIFEAFSTCFSVNFPEPDISDSMTLIGNHKAIPTI